MQAARPSCAELEEYLAQLRRKKVRAAEASSPPAEKRAGGGGCDCCNYGASHLALCPDYNTMWSGASRAHSTCETICHPWWKRIAHLVELSHHFRLKNVGLVSSHATRCAIPVESKQCMLLNKGASERQQSKFLRFGE